MRPHSALIDRLLTICPSRLARYTNAFCRGRACHRWPRTYTLTPSQGPPTECPPGAFTHAHLHNAVVRRLCSGFVRNSVPGTLVISARLRGVVIGHGQLSKHGTDNVRSYTIPFPGQLLFDFFRRQDTLSQCVARVVAQHTRTHTHTHARTRARTQRARTHACTGARTHERLRAGERACMHACVLGDVQVCVRAGGRAGVRAGVAPAVMAQLLKTTHSTTPY